MATTHFPQVTRGSDGKLSCSQHGETVVATVGPHTGRPMAECSECGAYMVTAELHVYDEQVAMEAAHDNRLG